MHFFNFGITLVHEHILVDFVGAREYSPDRWDRTGVVNKALPYLLEARAAGCETFFDCTPQYLGRDPDLLKELSEKSGLRIITNTGYYGGSDNKFLPEHAFSESADELSDRWVKEWEKGIDHSGMRPGFIKTSVNAGALTPISRKLVTAAARTHRKTGLTIVSHTGPALPAFEQIELLRTEHVSAGAFVWAHAQYEKDWRNFVQAVKSGCWVSLDGLSGENVGEYAEMLEYLKNESCLDRVLVSHDAGWYEPGKPGGGRFRGFTVLFDQLIPLLVRKGFHDRDIMRIIRLNPSHAFTVRVRENKLVYSGCRGCH
jgi:phosphotriesterase-related protein